MSDALAFLRGSMKMKTNKDYDGQRIDGLGRGYQPADLPTQRGHTMNLRQIHDITCDRLATQLVTGEKP